MLDRPLRLLQWLLLLCTLACALWLWRAGLPRWPHPVAVLGVAALVLLVVIRAWRWRNRTPGFTRGERRRLFGYRAD